jgi:hypothetical protein
MSIKIQNPHSQNSKVLNPANKLIPCPMPKFMYIGLENNTAPKAKLARHKSLPAEMDAAYCGYDIGM